MIFTKIGLLDGYASLHPGFKKAAEFVQTHDLNALPDGRTPVDGDDVYVNVMTAVPGNTEKKFEAHERYADIQVVLSGHECFGCACEGELPPLNEEKDLYYPFFADGFYVTLGAGDAVVFLPREPHAPDIPPTEDAGVRRKAVIKVRMR